MSYILGISAFYHDSAAALLKDDKIIMAIQEERLTRKKHDASFPINAIRYILCDNGLSLKELECVIFYDKPYIKFERLLETYHAFAPSGIKSFIPAMQVWIKEKIFIRQYINKELKKLGGIPPRLYFSEHHLSHAASAFYPSPFDEAAILTIDGVGEWSTTTVGFGNKNNISILSELHFPHSVGLLYSAMTYYCGFKVNSGEYKLMGLAPYGDPKAEQTKKFKEIILTELVDIREDGSILLNMDYFDFAIGLKMCRDSKWRKLFLIEKRTPESPLNKAYMNLALAIQQVTEEIILKLAFTAKRMTNSKNLVLAGGVALNCVANGKLLKSGIFENMWIQPAAGDAGGALGAAYTGWYILKGEKRNSDNKKDYMQGSFLGCEFSSLDITRVVKKYNAIYNYFTDFQTLCLQVADYIVAGNIIGWFQGKMEFGPRALGNRSILGDARHKDMQKRLNLKIKFREGFRPFAPVVLEEDIENFFDLDRPSPYMLLVASVLQKRRNPLPEGYEQMEMFDRLYHFRSDVPAITHVDYSARIQSVSRETNERFWELLMAYKRKTGYGILVNTSFNVRGEPMVCSPEDAFRCFMRTDMDYLVMGNFLFDKKEQPDWKEKINWRDEYALD